MVRTLRALALVAALGIGAVASAAASRLAPIDASLAGSTHAPFEMGACVACHDGAGPAGSPGASPGPVAKAASNDLCFDCHDEYRAPVRRHPATKGACVGCHSPHNAKKRKLLLGS